GAVGGQRRDGDLHEPAAADVLGRNDEPVVERAAEEVRRDGPGRELPSRRPRAVVGAPEGGQLLGELILGVAAEDRGPAIAVGGRGGGRGLGGWFGLAAGLAHGANSWCISRRNRSVSRKVMRAHPWGVGDPLSRGRAASASPASSGG